jgi:hypothetical protein
MIEKIVINLLIIKLKRYEKFKETDKNRVKICVWRRAKEILRILRMDEQSSMQRGSNFSMSLEKGIFKTK